MRTYDLSPLFRTTVGFDRLNRLFDSALTEMDNAPTYPPYNIESVSENEYRITVAVAGFSEDEIEVTQRENSLLVKGQTAPQDKNVVYLHRGIAGRAFERRFALADHVSVVDAKLANGMLEISLKRELPEALKPRRIAISHGGGPKRIARKKAA